MFGCMLMAVVGLNSLGSTASQAAGGPALSDSNITDADQAGAAAESLANSLGAFLGSDPASLLGGMIPQAGGAEPPLPGSSPFSLIPGLTTSNQFVSVPWAFNKALAGKLDLTFSQNGLDIDFRLRIISGAGSN